MRRGSTRATATSSCARPRASACTTLRRPGCKRSEHDIVQALTGTWRDEHLFVLAQSLDLYDHYTAKIAECDQRLDQQFSAMPPRFDIEGEPPPVPTSRAKKNSNSKNRPGYNVRAHAIVHVSVDERVNQDAEHFGVLQQRRDVAKLNARRWPVGHRSDMAAQELADRQILHVFIH